MRWPRADLFGGPFSSLFFSLNLLRFPWEFLVRLFWILISFWPKPWLLELRVPVSVSLAWVLMSELVYVLVEKPVQSSLQERQLLSPLFGGIFFFPGHFSPAFVRPRMIRGFRLDLTRILFRCCLWLFTTDGGCGDCDNCGSCGGCSVLLVLFGAKLGYMPHLLAAPTARMPSFHSHHHLPLSADNDLGDGLEALPS